MARQTTGGATAIFAALAAVLSIVLAVTVAGVYTGGFGEPEEPAVAVAADDADATEAAAAPHVVELVLDEFSFAPAAIEVPAGVPVEFHLDNAGGAPHDFVIEGVAESELVQPGETDVLAVGPLEPGEHAVICTEPGHAEGGMEGTLTVTDDADVAEADTPVADGEPPADAADDPHHGPHGSHGADHTELSPEEMAAQHDDFDYPVATEGEGNQSLEPELDDDGTKVFALTAEHVDWEVEPGRTVEAMAYNGQIPGPRLEVVAGDDVRIELTNELDVPTALHFHHLTVPNDMDGVPGVTQDSVLPGETFAYEFTISDDDVGSQMYHSHFDSAEQVPAGLLGTLVVDNPDLDIDRADEVDHDYAMVLNDGPLGYTLNGKGFPATEPLVVEEGDLIRVRYYNEGLLIHPMHLHGLRQEVVAYDGRPLPASHVEDNVLVSPGDRVDVLIEASEPGVWAWHCHVLSHAEGPDGMFGMVSAIVVEP